MSDFHEWERLPNEANDNPFTRPGAPDTLAAWRCTKCGWKVNGGLSEPPPRSDTKLFRRMPGGPDEWYNCDEIVALKIHDS